jgi:hypothetical protein
MAGGSASHVLHRPAEVYAVARYAYPGSVVPGARHDMNASVDALAPCRGFKYYIHIRFPFVSQTNGYEFFSKYCKSQIQGTKCTNVT